MRIIIITFVCSIHLNVFCQEVDQRIKEFWISANSQNDSAAIENGIWLLEYYQKNSLILDSNYLKLRTGLSECYKNNGDYNSALQINKRTISILDSVFIDSGKWKADVAALIADNYLSLGEASKSKDYHLVALNIRKELFGKENLDYVKSLSALANDNYILGNFDTSLVQNLECIEIQKKILSDQHIDYAESLCNLSLNYSVFNDHKRALKLMLESLEILKKHYRKENKEIAIRVHNLSQIYFDLGDYNKGLEYSYRAQKIFRNVQGEDEPSNLDNIAWGLYYQGDLKGAVENTAKSLEISKKRFGENHYDYAISLANLGVTYMDIGEYSKALSCMIDARRIYEITIGKDNLNYTQILQNLSNVFSYLGEYTKCIALEEEILEIHEKMFGKENDEYLNSLADYAHTLKLFGEHFKTIDIYKKCLIITEKTHGKKSYDYAQMLNNLAVNYQEIGNNKLALELNLEALETIKKITLKMSYAFILSHVASCYSALFNYEEAIKYDLRSLRIFKKTTGKDNRYPYVEMELCGLAYDYFYLKKYDKALKYHFKCLELIERALGPEHPEYASRLNDIAHDLIGLGDLNQAIVYHNKALYIIETAFGSKHPEYAKALQEIANDYYLLGNFDNFSEYYLKALNVNLSLFNRNKFGLDVELLSKIKTEIEKNFSLYMNVNDLTSNSPNETYSIWVQLNGVINSDISTLKNKVINSSDSTLIQLYKDFQTSLTQLNKYNEMPINSHLQNGISISDLEEKIEKIERQLSRSSKDVLEVSNEFIAADVQKNLNDCEVFIDIVSIPLFDLKDFSLKDSSKYVVFISTSKDTIINTVTIESSKQIEIELINNYKGEISERSKATDFKNDTYYNFFWKTIAEKIRDTKTVYVSLAGVYNNINLNTLYNPETGKYLFEEKDIRIVNSARDFVLSKERLSCETGAKKQYSSTTSSLYGFPDFNGNTTTSVDISDYLASTRDLHAMRIDSLTRGGLKASPLPATKIEIEQIATTFQKNGWTVNTFTGDKASETNIKREVSPRVLHVATHGYFFEDIPLDTTENRFLGMDRKRVVEDPMLRSGLLLTGANKTLQGEEPKGENGLLSAAEASLLDLRETELVVLSACETGKGEVKNSEGVYGLRKAFADAGAKNIIMSLWKVDDKVTQEFMTRFYEIWLNDKTTIREAFNRTQLEIKAKYPQPYYWGAFILVGE